MIRLLRCIDLEEQEQVQRYSLDQQHTLRSLKAEGLALHPLIVTRKNFGYADYPEISFRLNFPPEVNLFKDGAAIECFYAGESPVKGVLINLEGRSGEFRLFAPDFPDWIEDDGVGIKLAPDQRTTSIMKAALNELENNKLLFPLFEQLHGAHKLVLENGHSFISNLSFRNSSLNESQQQAVKAIMQNENMVIIHGPPGTGKTTTLVEGIFQLIKRGKRYWYLLPAIQLLIMLQQDLFSNL